MGCACSYGVADFVWSNVCPYLASASACSLPSILAWALTFWSVVVCVWDCNIDSRTSLSGWLLCLIWVFNR